MKNKVIREPIFLLRYLVTAPSSFRVDALETVFVQLFGYTSEVTVFVFLKDSMAPGHTVLSRDVLILNANNKYQALANVQVRNTCVQTDADYFKDVFLAMMSFVLSPQLYPNVLKKDIQKVVLHVQSDEINSHVLVPVSRNNGFLFIQTDKPLYTPHQKGRRRRRSHTGSAGPEIKHVNALVTRTFTGVWWVLRFWVFQAAEGWREKQLQPVCPLRLVQSH